MIYKKLNLNFKESPAQEKEPKEDSSKIEEPKKSVVSRFGYAELVGLALDCYTPEEIRHKSTVVVQQPQTYDQHGLVVQDGILDLRMGVCNANQICKTCNLNYLNCKGHMGSIELPFPVFHSELIVYTHTYLKHICNSCYQVQPLGYFSSGLYGVACVSCKTMLPVVKLIPPTGLLINTEAVNAQQVSEIFSNANLSKLMALIPKYKGYNPMKGILRVLVVGSMLMRPSLILESDKTSESDLTHKYADILRTISKYHKTSVKLITASAKTHFINLLQYHITTLFNNSSRGIPPAQHRSGKPLVGLIERIKGKEGRFRKHLAGKRVNHAIRAVITPNIHMAIDEIGCPRAVAAKMTKSDHITKYNIEEMLKLYDTNEIKYIIKDNRKLKVIDVNRDLLRAELSVKTQVIRSIQNGDTILMNRNPTLLPQSMLAFKVKLIDQSVFQIHALPCYGLNADADGDEMNGHIIQNDNATAECNILLGFKQNATLIKTGAAIMGITKGTLTGLYMLSTAVTLSAYEVACLVTQLSLDTEKTEQLNKLLKEKNLKGHDLLSLCFPSDLTISLKCGSRVIEIEKGQFKSGIINKVAVGPEGLLNTLIYGRYGINIYSSYVSNLTLLGANAAHFFGISYDLYGLINLKCDKELKPENLSQDIKKTELVFVKHYKANNDSNAYITAESGASGNVYTVIQTVLYMGQQSVSNWKRYSTMNFEQYALLQQDFIENSLLDGLDSMQYYSAAITARLALIDVFCKTAVVGYASRRILNGLEDFVVKGDRTIRNAANKIIALRYDGHGLDYNKINVHYPWIDMQKYYPLSSEKVYVSEQTLNNALAQLSTTHIGQKYADLLLKGMLMYLLTNQYDAVNILLNFQHFEVLENCYKLAEGTPIGLLTGQSFAQPLTQLNLHTKHNIGFSSLGSAVDKLLELLYNSKTNKYPFIRLETNVDNLKIIEKVILQVLPVKLKQLAQIDIDFENKQYIINFNSDLLNNNDLSVNGILSKLTDLGKLISSNENQIILSLPGSFTEIYDLNDAITNLAVKGIPDVKIEQTKVGSLIALYFYNLPIKKFAKILTPFNFEYDLRTNQLNNLYKMYGILTAEYYLNKEILAIFKSQGLAILEIHIGLIVKVMTLTGAIKGLSRAGVIADKGSLLARAGFEIANKVIIDGAVARATDNFRGIYENTMVCNHIHAGTTTNKLYLSTLPNAE